MEQDKLFLAGREKSEFFPDSFARILMTGMGQVGLNSRPVWLPRSGAAGGSMHSAYAEPRCRRGALL